VLAHGPPHPVGYSIIGRVLTPEGGSRPPKLTNPSRFYVIRRRVPINTRSLGLTQAPGPSDQPPVRFPSQHAGSTQICVASRLIVVRLNLRILIRMRKLRVSIALTLPFYEQKKGRQLRCHPSARFSRSENLQCLQHEPKRQKPSQ